MNNEGAALRSLEIVIPALVEPEGVELRESAVRAPGPREVVIAMEATGVSYAEVSMLRGRYPGQPAFPFVPGYDVVGRVHSVGSAVDRSLVGQRVATMTAFGAWAEYVVVEAESLVRVPESLDAAEVDALIVNGVTAYKMLHRAARVRAGQTVVVLGAGGGVGTILVQLCLLAGVHVIGTCRASQRAALEALGVRTVDYRSESAIEALRALAPDGVDAVFDHVGASQESYFAMLRKNGALVCYGNVSLAKKTDSIGWSIAKVMLKGLLWKLRTGGRKMTFFDVWGRGSFGADKLFRPRRYWREFREDLAALLSLLEARTLVPYVAARTPLREAGAALAAHKAGGFMGKIVLVNDRA